MKKTEDFTKEFDEELIGYFTYEHIRKFLKKLKISLSNLHVLRFHLCTD